VGVGACVAWLVFGEPVVGHSGCDLADGGVGASVVVDVDEVIDEYLEFGEVGCWRFGCEPFLHRLLEPFDFAGGGRVAWSSVFLGDPEFAESGLELVPAAGKSGESDGIDQAVVGEH